MLSRTLKYYNVLRNFARTKIPKRNLAVLKKIYTSKCTKVVFASQFYNMIKSNSQDLDLSLKKACDEGETAVIELMNVLKQCFLEASIQYRTCIKKQIEITQQASLIGLLSEKWDELPEYRTMADDLSQELNNYMVLFKTIGQMAYDQSIISVLSGNGEQLEVVGEKYKELEILLLHELELNKKLEMELLTVKRDSILQNVPNDEVE